VSARNREGLARRSLEIAPPLLVWATITAPVWAALAAPSLLGFAMVAFSVYWLWKSAWFAAGVVVGYLRLKQAQLQDWEAEGRATPGYADLRHLVLVPTCGESEEILADTLQHLVRQEAGPEREAVVLAFEERDPSARERARVLEQRFARHFGLFLATFHPDLPGEVKGKSSNLAWAARRVAEAWVDTGLLDPGRLVVTVCDADSRLHSKYLSALGGLVAREPAAQLHIFQPAILFYANHWRLHAPLRALNSIYSLYELARMVPSHRLVTQSTYSLTWWVARDVDFWDVDVIPEDSHMFFKVLFHFGRRVKVRPIFLPVYADAAEGPTLQRTLANTYLQIRRWAWGVSDVPYVVLGALRAPDMPWYTRLARMGWYIEEHFMWPTHWFLLTLGGLVPRLLNPAYAHSTLGLWQAGLISAIMGLCLPCLGIVIFIDWRLRPAHPDGEDLIDALLGMAAFGLLPFVSFGLAALPALDAHTRLLFGRYLEYRVTEKVALASQPRVRRPVWRPLGGGLEQLPQYLAYAPGSTTAVTDSVLLVYRDLR
jgi:cellulose synthase/poly-beta-1,6-N-acetylglucosamine synthase-like glycosyltransferase